MPINLRENIYPICLFEILRFCLELSYIKFILRFFKLAKMYFIQIFEKKKVVTLWNRVEEGKRFSNEEKDPMTSKELNGEPYEMKISCTVL